MPITMGTLVDLHKEVVKMVRIEFGPITVHDKKAEETASVLADLIDQLHWKPMHLAPRDGTPIECWHVRWKTPVAVTWNPGMVEGCPWVTTTKATTWPEDAFTLWRPISFAPERSHDATPE